LRGDKWHDHALHKMAGKIRQRLEEGFQHRSALLLQTVRG
jgi:hypothetical protein